MQVEQTCQDSFEDLGVVHASYPAHDPGLRGTRQREVAIVGLGHGRHIIIILVRC